MPGVFTLPAIRPLPTADASPTATDAPPMPSRAPEDREDEDANAGHDPRCLEDDNTIPQCDFPQLHQGQMGEDPDVMRGKTGQYVSTLYVVLMQICANLCKSVQICADLCRSVQICADLCKSVQIYANLCKSMQKCANQCRNVQICAVM